MKARAKSRWVYRCVAVLFLAACGFVTEAVQPAQAKTKVHPEDARQVAARLVLNRRPQAALPLIETLLNRDPTDTEALILKAHSMRLLGRYSGAIDAARAAWGSAHSPDARFGAAMAMAQALSSADRRTEAQLWLRRAAQAAPSDTLKARAARDLAYVRARAPVSVALSFGIRPSNNINNAPRDNTLRFGQIVLVNPTAVPISGVAVTGGATLRFRLDQRQTSETVALINLSQSEIYFTDDMIPAGVEAGDFRQQSARVRLSHSRRAAPDAPLHRYDLSVGRLWYGGSFLLNDIAVAYGQSRSVSPTLGFSWRAQLAYADRQDNAARSGWTTSLHGSWTQSLRTGATLRYHLGAARVLTDSPAETTTRLSTGADYILAHPIFGAQTQLSIAAQFRDDDTALYAPVPRNDTRLSTSATFFFTDFDIYGFAPTLSLHANRTLSNITRFDTESLGVSIGIRSVF